MQLNPSGWKKALLVILFLLPIAGKSYAAKDLDSLRAVISAHPQDTSGAGALLSLAGSYLRTDLDSAVVLAEQARAIALRLDDQEFEARSENTLGIARLFQGDNQASLAHFLELLRIREKQGDKSLIAKANNNVALSYQGSGQYALALDHHFSSLQAKEELGDSSSIRISYNNIGLIYEKIQDYPMARKYYLLAQAMIPMEDDSNAYATFLYNIGITYVAQNKYDSARYWLDQSYPLVKALGDLRMTGVHQLNYGRMALFEENYELADSLVQVSLETLKQVGKKDLIAGAYSALGTNRLRQGAPREAIGYCEDGLKLARELTDLSQESRCVECLHEAYATIGQYQQAYHYLEEYQMLEDSLGSEEVKLQIARQDLENNFKKRQLADSLETARQNALITVEHENEQDRLFSLTIFVTIIGILLLGVIFLLVFILRGNQRQKDVLEKRVKDRTAELERQKNQLAEYAFINAHLMRQPLAQIMGLIPLIQVAEDKNERDQYLEYLQRSSQKLDDVIHEVRDIVEKEGNGKDQESN